MYENTIIFIIGYGSGLFTIIFLVLIKYYWNRWMNYEDENEDEDEDENEDVPIQRPIEIPRPEQIAEQRPENLSEQIDALIIHIVPPNASLVDETCLVCLEEITIKQAVVECTTCHRVLGHASCLENWFHQKLSCPNCRQIFIEST